MHIPLFRGTVDKSLLDLKEGDEFPMNKVNSFSSSEDTAGSFILNKIRSLEDKPIMIAINTPCKALNIQPLSYYSNEDEYFVGKGYKVEKIEDREIERRQGRYITISFTKEIKDD